MAAKRKRWAIDERGAPSTRSYLALVRRYHREKSVFVRRVLRELIESNPSPDLATVSRIVWATQQAEPPSAADIARQNAPQAAQAHRLARRDLLKAGASPAMLTAAGIPDVSAIDILQGGFTRDTLTSWAREGTDFIKGIATDRAPTLEARLMEHVAAGDRWETVRETVAQELGIQGRRGDLIARDQVAKLNGKITQDLQTQAEVSSYIWRASRDGRVRESHAAVDGQEWTWADGAPDVGFYGERGHPGQAGQCRCTAEPVIPDTLRTDSDVTLWYTRRVSGRVKA